MSSNLLRGARQHRKERVIKGRITVSGGTPAIAAGQGFTISDQGAGIVRVTPDKPGKRILGVLATAIEATTTAAHIVKVLSDPTANALYVDFGVYVVDGTDGVLVDNVGFSFQIDTEEVRA